jgi:predicted nucleic acid-binding protein
MIIIDTNVLSELMKAQPDASVAAWLKRQDPTAIFTTTISEAEIRFGVALLPDGQRRRALDAAAQAMFAEDFEDRVLVFDSEAATAYAQTMTERRAAGKPIAILDAMVASIARACDASVATRNVRDFLGCGVDVINPWDA